MSVGMATDAVGAGSNTGRKTAAEPVIRAEGLAFGRDGRDLARDVSFELAPGDWLFIAGASGLGKSSLLACLGGLLAPTAGRVSVLGRDPHAPSARRALRGRIGFVFQDFRLATRTTALENVLTGRLARRSWLRTLASRFPPAEIREAAKLLEELGLAEESHKQARFLSGGQQQRVAVARTLFQEPSLILADEPVSNLDPALARRVLDLMRAHTRRTGAALICVTHDLQWVEAFGGRCLNLGDGAAR